MQNIVRQVIIIIIIIIIIITTTTTVTKFVITVSFLSTARAALEKRKKRPQNPKSA
jgi:hypothetical protein